MMMNSSTDQAPPILAHLRKVETRRALRDPIPRQVFHLFLDQFFIYICLCLVRQSRTRFRVRPIAMISSRLTLYLSLLAACPLALVHAGQFDSTDTGPWENDATWTAPSHPDVYGSDSATVKSGHTVEYTGVGLSFPSTNGNGTTNFAVANGNSLTIDGGVWRHAWADYSGPFGNALSIGVSGSSNGLGYLTIENGGTFDSADAANVAIGQTLGTPGLGAGSGTVDIDDGTFRVGAGNPAAGFAILAIGSDNGGTGVVNVGDGSGATNTALLDLATDNAALALGVHAIDPANPNGGSGTLTVESDGRLTWGTRTAVLGDTLNSTGALEVRAGGSVVAGTSHLIVGQNGNTSASLNLSGSLTKLGDITVGQSNGKGTLTVDSSGTLDNSGGLVVGTGAGSVGVANLAGTSLLDHLIVGLDGGSGTLNMSGGNVVVADSATLAASPSGITTGTINLTGGTLQITGGLTTPQSASSSASLTLDGGTLDLQGGMLKVDSLSPISGTLRNVGQIQSGDNTTPLVLTKTSSGALTLDGTNGFSGSTAVLAGSATINGELSTSPVTIAVGSTLRGSGTLGANCTIDGTHAPGPVGAVGTQTFEGPLVYGANSTLEFDLFTNSESSGSGDMVAAEALTISAGAEIDLKFNGAGSSVDFTSAFWDIKRSWRIISVAASRAGEFTLGNISSDAGGVDPATIGLFYLEHSGSGIDLVWDNLNSPIVQWRMAKFGSDYADESIAGNGANPDSDDFSNLIEYGTGSDPNRFDPNPGNIEHYGTFIKFEYTRNSHATDVSYCVQYTAVLEVSPEDDNSVLITPPPPESWSKSGVSQTMISDDGDRQVWCAQIPTPPETKRLFFRLRVTH